ncbi:hypothetical protein HDU83_008026 [Entophlyctis luteolus]|nr:hypothetical protein HDU83_008026 [Entophlyctis luteolus]
MPANCMNKFRDDKKRKRERESYELLRIKKQYHKLLRNEGIPPERPASESAKAHHDEDAQSEAMKAGILDLEAESKRKGRKMRASVFAKTVREREGAARQHQEEVERAAQEREAAAAERGKKLRQRQRQHAIYSQRTRRGQPVLGRQVDELLARLRTKVDSSSSSVGA